MGKNRCASLVAVLVAVVAGALYGSAAVAAGTCSASTPQYCPTPTVHTTAATNITSTSATLNGTVNPNGVDTTCFFKYGTTTTPYSSTTPPQNVGSGTSTVPVSANVTGLTPGTTYHFQLFCQNVGASAGGGDRTFTTSAAGKCKKLKIKTRVAKVSKHGKVRFKVKNRDGHKCRGTATLTTLKGTPLTKHSKHFVISAHKTKVIVMKLTKAALAQLNSRPHRRRKARFTMNANGVSPSKVVVLHRV